MAVLVLCWPMLLSSSRAAEKGPAPRYRVFKLNHISSEAAIGHLETLGLANAVALTRPGAIQVSGTAADLVKARAVIDLVDSSVDYVSARLQEASRYHALSKEALLPGETEAALGSFVLAPEGEARHRILLDTHGDHLVVVAPRPRFATINEALAALVRPADESANRLVGSVEQQGAADPNAPSAVPPLRDAELEAMVDRVVASLSAAAGPVGDQKTTADYSPLRQPGRSYKPEPIPQAETSLLLNLPEKLQLIDLLDLLGKHLDLDYVYEEKDLQNQTVSLRIQGPITVAELYPTVESIMTFKGLAMSRQENLVTIVPAEEALSIDPVLLDDETGEVAYGSVVVTRIFRLRHVDPDAAQSLLTSMELAVSMTPIEGVNTLIVTGFAHRMGRIERLLTMIDQPGPPRVFRFRQLRYTLAGEMAPRLSSLAGEMGAVTVSIGASTGSQRMSSRTPGRPTPGASAARLPTSPAGGTSSSGPSKQVYLEADERTNRILMIGLESQLEKVEALIDALDVERPDVQTMRLYEIQHVSAAEVRDHLAALGMLSGPADTGRIGRGRASAARSPGGGPSSSPGRITSQGPATGEGDTLTAAEPTVIVLSATNALLIRATASQHAEIVDILSYVDTRTLDHTIPYEMYFLENQDPENLAAILDKLISETILDQEGKVETIASRIEDDIVIVPDKNTFSLIVYASMKHQEWIRKLIALLDKRRPQVLIDVTLVEINKNDTFTYDLELVTKLPELPAGGSMDLLAPLLAPGGVLPSNQVIEASSLSGTGTGFYADHHIQALLQIMETKGYGRVMAKPKVLVNDNEAGKITAKDTTYIETKGASVLQGVSEAIETSVVYQPYDAGIELSITPHISEGELLRLEITMNRSDFTNVSGTKPPDTTSSDLETVVTVPDGSTIILGGLVKLNQSKGASKVPVLGDIPLLGALFRSTSNQDIQKRLYIFLKAEIVRPSESTATLQGLEELSTRNQKALEAAEDDFHRAQDLQGLPSQSMSPTRSLETQ